jgi:tripartite-type tricarboxylate transporter receptor subunit TctC
MNTIVRKWSKWLMPAVLAHGATALAQDKVPGYPVRPIRLIIGVAPGAGADIIARMTAEILRESWGQNVVVDPRPGGGGVVASTYAAKAEPGGYTLYQNGFGLILQGAAKRVPFDVLKTFVPAVRSTAQPYVLLVSPNIAAKSIKELVALSAARPLTYAGSSGTGSTVHIGMERLAKQSGMKARHIAYKGSSVALLALMGGEINMAATSIMSAVGAIKTGKVRALANMGLERVPALPDLPTIVELGYPKAEIANMYNLWVPAGTPGAIVTALNSVVSKGLNTPEMTKRLAALGATPVKPMPPNKVRADIEREYVELQQSVKELGLKF